MSDIFVSYASEDRVRVGTLVRLLESAGWSVWWDRDLEGGRERGEDEAGRRRRAGQDRRGARSRADQQIEAAPPA